jgi:chromosome segregation ATPase
MGDELRLGGAYKMCRLSYRLFIPILVLLGLSSFSPMSFAYDEQAYENLLRSRDALVNQQADLQTEYDDTNRQIDALNARLTSIDYYLRQLDSSMKDLDTAITYARQKPDEPEFRHNN